LRLCIFTNHFFPEDFKINDIAFELVKRGYEITVITAIPDYPQGKYYDGYSLFKRRREYVNDVLVYRLPIIPRRKGRKIDIILNYISYFFSVLFFTIFFLYKKEYDTVFVHLTSPFFIGFPAALLKRKQHIPLIFWTLDLWPESLSAAGGITNKFILDTQIRLAQFVYGNCDKILIGSPGFEKSICEKGKHASKLVYFPNWAEDVAKNHTIINLEVIFPFSNFTSDDFILLFAGNMGEAQNLDSLIEAAKLTTDNSKIKWVFLGDGRCRSILEKKVIEYGLQNTVFFPGRFPLGTMPVFMKRADVLLVSLKDELIFNLTIPAKVQFYMAQGKPILGMLNGDGADLISKAQCGYCVPAGDYNACSEIVRKICKEKDLLKILGQNGEEYYKKHFQKKDRIDQLEMIINRK
jgi:glycosyltransferase involved in cell wall biosynthesis